MLALLLLALPRHSRLGSSAVSVSLTRGLRSLLVALNAELQKATAAKGTHALDPYFDLTNITLWPMFKKARRHTHTHTHTHSLTLSHTQRDSAHQPRVPDALLRPGSSAPVCACVCARVCPCVPMRVLARTHTPLSCLAQVLDAHLHSLKTVDAQLLWKGGWCTYVLLSLLSA
eukprot:COSAG03_NODE_3726_length_1857_cov_428.260523_3_plen_173_part_00